jgi:UV DNA damage endonuclease
MLELCAGKRIRLYRLTSALFPFADHELGRGVLGAFRRPLAEAGGRAAELGIRLVVHPDQFVVLNSESPAVAASSAAMLRGQGRVLDLLGQPRSPWAAITIHGGKSGRPRELVRAVRRLPAAVRSRLVLENDERCYGAGEILAICREARVPMVFDAHHHAVHEGLSTYEDPSTTLFTRAAARTWPDPGWQIVHISNGRDSFRDPTHSDYIRAVPSAFLDVPWIEVEAKAKEKAIASMITSPWR